MLKNPNPQEHASMSMFASSADYWRAQAEANAKDAERYRWLREHPLCSVGYRFKPRTGKTEWRMRKEGEYWGHWWPTHEQAVDHAMALDKEGERTRAVGAA